MIDILAWLAAMGIIILVWARVRAKLAKFGRRICVLGYLGFPKWVEGMASKQIEIAKMTSYGILALLHSNRLPTPQLGRDGQRTDLA